MPEPSVTGSGSGWRDAPVVNAGNPDHALGSGDEALMPAARQLVQHRSAVARWNDARAEIVAVLRDALDGRDGETATADEAGLRVTCEEESRALIALCDIADHVVRLCGDDRREELLERFIAETRRAEGRGHTGTVTLDATNVRLFLQRLDGGRDDSTRPLRLQAQAVLDGDVASRGLRGGAAAGRPVVRRRPGPAGPGRGCRGVHAHRLGEGGGLGPPATPVSELATGAAMARQQAQTGGVRRPDAHEQS